MELQIGKTTSYQDLLRSFQEAGQPAQTPRSQKLIYRPHHSKNSIQKSDKQNLTTRIHTQSVHEKSINNRSDWTEDNVLKQYNHNRKDRQLELAYNKFITYITNILATLTQSVPPQLLTHNITYLQYLAAMKEMSMIKDTYQPSPTDSVSMLWHDLSAHGHTCGAFILFVANILQMRKSQDQHSPKYTHLVKKYAQLRYTRMEMLGKIKTVVDEQEYPFTPAISQRSRTLAGSRSKSKPRTDRCLAQRSMNSYLDESQNQEHNSSIQNMDTLAGNRRSEILYKLAKERSLEKKRDKKSNEVEYQKSIKQLTFHPRIHPNNAKAKKKKEIQGEQDSVNRIIRGRVEREVRKIINQKGLPFNQKLFERMKRERYEALEKQKKQHECPYRHYEVAPQPAQNEKQPQTEAAAPVEQEQKKTVGQPIVLTIQVDQNRCQKLVIDDPARYKEAAARFIQHLNLGSEMYDKLIEGVEKALKFQLTQVDEDSCEEEYDSAE